MLDEPVELPLLAHPRSEAILVDTLDSLSLAVSELSTREGPIAIDAERASGYKYFPKAYLIQLHKRGGSIYLVDPAAFTGNSLDVFAELAQVLSADEWILHAATQDLPCLSELGFVPNRLFDTELASRILGLDRVGLGSICESLLNYRLAKEHSAVDWSTRPLKDEWLNYAALDVDVLHDLRDAIIVKLRDEGKLEWASEEFAELVHFKPRPKDAEKWRTLSGLHQIKDRRKLSIARSLWITRDELAQKLDVSPGRLLPDTSVIEAAMQSPKSRAELVANKSFSGRASRSYSDLWWKAIEDGLSVQELPELKVFSSQVPHHRFWKQKYPDAFLRLERAKSVIADLSQKHRIPAENILSPDILRQICWNLELSDPNKLARELEKLGARAWQIQMTSTALAESFIAPAGPAEDSNPQE